MNSLRQYGGRRDPFSEFPRSDPSKNFLQQYEKQEELIPYEHRKNRAVDKLMHEGYVSKKELRKKMNTSISGYGEAEDAILNMKLDRLGQTLAQKPDFYSSKIDEIVRNSTYFTQDCINKVRKFMTSQYPNIYPLSMSDPHVFLTKLSKYFSRKEFNHLEKELFIKLIRNVNQIEVYNMIQSMPASPIANFLGEDKGQKAIKVESKDYQELNMLKGFYTTGKRLDRDVLIQSSTYRDCSPDAIYGVVRDEFKKNDYVSSLLVALYLNVLPTFENLTLHSNFARIVLERSILVDRRETLKSDEEAYGDSLLTHSIVNDPVAMTISEETPLSNICKRYLVQRTLKQVVFMMRSGVFYGSKYEDPTDPIGNYRQALDRYDDPFVDFNTDTSDPQKELEKIQSVFSHRPTIITLTTTLPDFASIGSFGPRVNSRLSSIANINVMLPPNIGTQKIKTVTSDMASRIKNGNVTPRMVNPYEERELDTSQVNLEDTLSKEDYIFHNNIWSIRQKSICMTDNVIFFCIDRKTQSRGVYNLVPGALPFLNTLPSNLNSRINKTDVIFNEELLIGGSEYSINSAVMLETDENLTDYFTNTSAIIFLPEDHPSKKSNDSVLYYNPDWTGARMKRVQKDGSYVNPHPITVLPRHDVDPNAYAAYPFLFKNCCILIFALNKKKKMFKI